MDLHHRSFIAWTGTIYLSGRIGSFGGFFWRRQRTNLRFRKKRGIYWLYEQLSYWLEPAVKDFVHSVLLLTLQRATEYEGCRLLAKEKLQKRSRYFCYVCLSFCPFVTTWYVMNWFSFNFLLDILLHVVGTLKFCWKSDSIRSYCLKKRTYIYTHSSSVAKQTSVGEKNMPQIMEHSFYVEHKFHIQHTFSSTYISCKKIHFMFNVQFI